MHEAKPPVQDKPILTEDDVLKHVRAVLQFGYGQVEIDIYDGYIRIIRPTRTILGRRPS